VVVDTPPGFDDVAFAQSRSLLLFDEEEGEETTGVLESIIILYRYYLKQKHETFGCF
jgi:hypothetical protein|tara:strand:- start:453 stop:623 length:171 start_codon:yes stop_codon:yes gene_type:complete